jgi:hypothetical protein
MTPFAFFGRAAAAIVVGLTAAIVGGGSLAPAARADSVAVLLDGYIPRFKQKKDMNREYGDDYEDMRAAIVARQTKGQDMDCSVQILTEVGWLIQYTNFRPRVEKRLADLRGSFNLPAEAQRAARDQSATDGSWGGCFEEWFLRMHASADPLKELAHAGRKPTHPLKFLEAIDTPEKIRARMAELKTTRVAQTGRDHRKELNLTVTGLGQMLFLKNTASVMPPDFPREAVANALKDFMDKEWQDPKTGYWGPWYEIDGKIIKAEDLSMTFHIASYRGGEVPNLHRLVRTTLRIRDRPYPYGWQDRGTQNNHHSYDVVRLLRFGWPLMTSDERAKAQAEMFIITARALRLSLNGVGEFDPRPYSALDEAYYFGISALDELGYFRDSRRFWINYEPEGSEELRAMILANIERIGGNSPMMAEAKRKLLARD